MLVFTYFDIDIKSANHFFQAEDAFIGLFRQLFNRFLPVKILDSRGSILGEIYMSEEGGLDFIC